MRAEERDALPTDHETARRLVQHGKILPLARVIQAIPAMARGRILEIELEQRAGRLLYEIEWVDDAGQVWEERFDAVSGLPLARQPKE
ncbi:MAG: hypothetical protein HQL66_07770 [Magnetococcales bacterium]|nr:hypothetical protein [Magnetococcales bacterium]